MNVQRAYTACRLSNNLVHENEQKNGPTVPVSWDALSMNDMQGLVKAAWEGHRAGLHFRRFTNVMKRGFLEYKGNAQQQTCWPFSAAFREAVDTVAKEVEATHHAQTAGAEEEVTEHDVSDTAGDVAVMKKLDKLCRDGDLPAALDRDTWVTKKGVIIVPTCTDAA